MLWRLHFVLLGASDLVYELCARALHRVDRRWIYAPLHNTVVPSDVIRGAASAPFRITRGVAEKQVSEDFHET